MSGIVGNGSHVYVDVEKLRTPCPGVDCCFQRCLGGGREIDAQILDAVLVDAGVLNLLCVDPNRLSGLLRLTSGGNGLIRHSDSSLQCKQPFRASRTAGPIPAAGGTEAHGKAIAFNPII